MLQQSEVLDLGLSKNNDFLKKMSNHEFKFIYLLGSDNLEIEKNDEFIVYQGSHGDRGAEIADVILPSPHTLNKTVCIQTLRAERKNVEKPLSSGKAKDELENNKI